MGKHLDQAPGIFSVQILHEQTSWLISQTSIAIMPMVVIASLELVASNGENWEW